MLEICSACLSGGRHLVSLRNLRHLFDTISWLDVEFNIDEDCMCWECESIIARMQKFRNQVIGAQEALRLCREIARPITTLKSLSNLSAVYIDNNDVTVNEQLIDELNEHNDNIENFVVLNDTINISNSDNNSIVVDLDDDDFEVNAEDTNVLVLVDNKYNAENKVPNKTVNISKKKTGVTRDKNELMKFSKNEMKFTITKMSLEELESARELDKNSVKYQTYRFKCEKCIMGYYDENRYKNHLEEKHSTKSGEHKCSICEVGFNRRDAMKHHYDCHFRRYQCKLCQYSHHKLKTMLIHYSRAHEEKKYECKSCKKVFDVFGKLRYHRNTVHKELPKCNVCKKSFTSKESLKVHNIFMHFPADRVPVYPCGVCGKQCRGRAAHRAHVRTHDTIPAAAREHAFCAECGVQFKSEMLYQRHLLTHRRHRTSDVLKFACPHCDAKFLTKSVLQRHEAAVHLKKYTFNCHLCNRGFMRKHRLKDHVMEVHEGISRPKDKICSYCGKGFKDRQVLVTHMRTHTGEKPHKCTHCGVAFAQRAALNTHVRALHLKQPKKNRKGVARRTDDSVGAKYAAGRTKTIVADAAKKEPGDNLSLFLQ